MRIQISSKALKNHDWKLYDADKDNPRMMIHSEDANSTYIIIKESKTLATVEMSRAAIKRFLTDVDFEKDQIDFYHGLFKEESRLMIRAGASLRKQLAQQCVLEGDL